MTDAVVTVPMDKMAKVYVRIRDKIAELTKSYEAEVEALKAQQAIVASSMKEELRAAGMTSAKTEYGTVSIITKTRFVAQDWAAMKQFIIDNAAVDLLENRIAQKNMGEFLANNPGVVPAGLNTISEQTVSVRRPTK